MSVIVALRYAVMIAVEPLPAACCVLPVILFSAPSRAVLLPGCSKCRKAAADRQDHRQCQNSSRTCFYLHTFSPSFVFFRSFSRATLPREKELFYAADFHRSILSIACSPLQDTPQPPPGRTSFRTQRWKSVPRCHGIRLCGSDRLSG